MRRLPLVGGTLTAAVLLVGCSSAPPQPSRSPTVAESARSTLTGEVVVFAAASLTDSFAEVADEFTEANRDVTVTVSLGGSSALSEQIVAGAPVDVFAAASPATMTTVTDAGLADGDPQVFVRNILEIAVPTGNPGDITSIADFADADRTIALCAPEVPCGAAAAKVFAAAGITAAPDTLEQDVRAALTKVQLGEVDAAMVYRTDVLAAGDAVQGIPFEEAGDAINDYPIAVLSDAPNPDAAAAFVDFVLSEAGQAILSDAGFQTD